MLLELGSGGNPTEGFEHADVRPGNHVEHVFNVLTDPFPFKEGSVKHLLMHQTLEHFGRVEAVIVLKKCKGVLASNGILQLSVPNIEGWMRSFFEGNVRWNDTVERIYGGQDYEYNFHKWGYSEKSMRELLTDLGFKHLDFSGSCWTDIHVKGVKQ